LLKKRILMITAAIVGVMITVMRVTAATWPVINVVETGVTREYPDVLPLYYSADPQRVFQESKASVEALERFDTIEADIATREIKAEATTRVFGFVDDVTITIEPVTEFVTRVNVRSASRVGKGDFGQNARNIRRFFTELDSRLGAVRFDPDAQPKSAKDKASPSDASEAKPGQQ